MVNIKKIVPFTLIKMDIMKKYLIKLIIKKY